MRSIALFDQHTVLGGVQRYLLDVARGLKTRRKDAVVYVAREGALSQQFAGLDLPVHLPSLPRWVMEGRSPAFRNVGWQSVLRLAKIFRTDDIGLAYANSTATAVLSGLAMRLAHGHMIWRVSRASEVERSPFLSRFCYSLAEHVHVASTVVGRTVSAVVGDTQRMRQLPPGMVLDHVKFAEPITRKPGQPLVIGMFGAWSPQKGQEVLMRAFRLLQAGGLPARLQFGGKAHSAEEERYRSIVLGAARAGGIGNLVRVAEEVPDILEFLAECDIIVIPSLAESSGRTALEAAAVGRPVIASRVDGLTEILEDGRTGLLAPPNDPNSLADALALLLASSALRAQMGRQARIRVEEHHRIDPTLDAIEEVMKLEQ